MLGKTTFLKGELRAFEDITVEGRVEGAIWCENFAVTLGPSANVNGDITARDITIFGRMAGRLVATDVVDVRAEATVTGQVISKRFILNDGAHFNGRAEPQHLEAAMRVARFQQQREAERASARPDSGPVSAGRAVASAGAAVTEP